jgi:hypothetical protein
MLDGGSAIHPGFIPNGEATEVELKKDSNTI